MRVLHVVCDRSGGGAEHLVADLARFGSVQAEVATVQDGGPIDFGVPTRCAHRTRGSLGVRALVRLARWAREFDVVHTHLWAGHVWGGTAARIAGVPWVATTHNLDRDEPRWKHLLRRRRPDVHIAVSQAVAREVPGSTVVHNGVDLRRFPRRWVGGAGPLCIGRVAPQKGFDRLRDLGVRHVGVGVCGLVHLGPRPRSAIPDLLATADVVVVPSRWEGFGLVALEAMAAGAPVLAMGVDGLREVVGDGGVLVDSVSELRRSVVRIAADRPLQQELSARGRRRARRFGIERCVERTEALYRRAVSSG